jgi:hypothetical protein
MIRVRFTPWWRANRDRFAGSAAAVQGQGRLEPELHQNGETIKSTPRNAYIAKPDMFPKSAVTFAEIQRRSSHSC